MKLKKGLQPEDDEIFLLCVIIFSLKNLPHTEELSSPFSLPLGKLCIYVHVHKTCAYMLHVHIHTIYKTLKYSLRVYLQ